MSKPLIKSPLREIYIDVETSGTDKIKHGLIQLAGIIIIDGKEEDEFNFKVQPHKGKFLDQEALAVNKLTVEEIRTFEAPQIIHKQFCNMLSKYVDKYNKREKFIFYAYMPSGAFDAQFVRQFFEDNGDMYYSSWFFSPEVDISSLAIMALKNKRHEMPNFKLGTVARELGIEFDSETLHDALADIRITKEVKERSLKIIESMLSEIDRAENFFDKGISSTSITDFGGIENHERN